MTTPTSLPTVAELVRQWNPAGSRLFAGVDLAEIGPDDAGGYVIAAGEVPADSMAAAVNEYDGWCGAYDPLYPIRPASVQHLAVAVLDDEPDGLRLDWGANTPGRVHMITMVAR